MICVLMIMLTCLSKMLSLGLKSGLLHNILWILSSLGGYLKHSGFGFFFIRFVSSISLQKHQTNQNMLENRIPQGFEITLCQQYKVLKCRKEINKRLLRLLLYFSQITNIWLMFQIPWFPCIHLNDNLHCILLLNSSKDSQRIHINS